MADLVPPLHYEDPIVHNKLRAYADDRGFAQITLERHDGEQISIRIRGEWLRQLIAQLTITAAAADPRAWKAAAERGHP